MFHKSLGNQLPVTTRIEILINKLEQANWNYVQVNFPAVYSQIGAIPDWVEAIDLIYQQSLEMSYFGYTYFKSFLWFGEPFHRLSDIIQFYLVNNDLRNCLDEFNKALCEELEGENNNPDTDRIKITFSNLDKKIDEIITLLKWKVTHDVNDTCADIKGKIVGYDITEDEIGGRIKREKREGKFFTYTFKNNYTKKYFQNGLLGETTSKSRLARSIDDTILNNPDISIESLNRGLKECLEGVISQYKIRRSRRLQREVELIERDRERTLVTAATIEEQTQTIQKQQGQIAFFERSRFDYQREQSSQMSQQYQTDESRLAAAPTLRTIKKK